MKKYLNITYCLVGLLATVATLPVSAKTWQHNITITPHHNTVITATLQLANSGGPMQITLGQLKSSHENFQIAVYRDKAGRTLTVIPAIYNKGKWVKNPSQKLKFWPSNKKEQARLKKAGVSEYTWHGRDIALRVVCNQRHLSVYIAGQLVASFNQLKEADNNNIKITAISFHGAKGDTVRNIHANIIPGGWQYVSANLSAIAHQQVQASQTANKNLCTIDGIPFTFVDGGHKQVSLHKAEWEAWKRDPTSFYERYAKGAPFIGDPRMPMIQIPKADYTAAWVLAVAAPNKKLSNRLTLRIGHTGYSMDQVVRYDFVAKMPRGSGKKLYAVRVPMPAAFSQDIVGNILHVEITKTVRLARRSSGDPARARWRPLGLPSGVQIAAITFQRSPLQMDVSCKPSGNLFVQPHKPVFNVKLTNISNRTQQFRLALKATHFDGTIVKTHNTGQVDAGQQITTALSVPKPKRGYYQLAITLEVKRNNAWRPLLTRHTSFAVLPDKQRPFHNECPVGVWDFSGGHWTPSQASFVGPIYRKLGLRYGMFSFTAKQRAKYGVRKGNALTMHIRNGADSIVARYKKDLAQNPDLLRRVLLFHEDSISGPHVTRVPDLFSNRPPYQMNAKEKKRFKEMFDMAEKAARKIRAYNPKIKLILGNGPLPLREAFYRHHFPASLFNAAGNESAQFDRMPERQPPDVIASNASLWMDRQMLDHYGYPNKPILQCYETIYPTTNPGSLNYRTQAAYFVREILLDMAWRLPQIRVGSLTDMGDSYYFSHWGASGIFHAKPKVNPKPAAVEIGTLTWVLDGASFNRVIPMDSDSLYALAFNRPLPPKNGKRKSSIGHVVAMWTIRGKRPVTFTLDNATRAKLINGQGIETPLHIDHNKVTITLTAIPCYLATDGKVIAATAGKPSYHRKPHGKIAVLSPLNTLNKWHVSLKDNPLLDYYDPMQPRRKGDFSFQIVSQFQGKKNVIKVTPHHKKEGKATVAMYAALVSNKGIAIPGQPTRIGLWVNGNSSWGRVIFCLTDAKGQRWVSIGAPAKKGSKRLAEFLSEKKLKQSDPGAKIADWNTNDVYGQSSINFDGWRYISYPLPGQYPGEGYGWVGNSQWYHSGSGYVNYPLTLNKIIVQLPAKTLHVKNFAPAKRPPIYLSKLICVTGNKNKWIKQTPGGYVADVQMNGL